MEYFCNSTFLQAPRAEPESYCVRMVDNKIFMAFKNVSKGAALKAFKGYPGASKHPAEEQGMRVEDLIISINGTQTTNHEAVSAALKHISDGEMVSICTDRTTVKNAEDEDDTE